MKVPCCWSTAFSTDETDPVVLTDRDHEALTGHEYKNHRTKEIRLLLNNIRSTDPRRVRTRPVVPYSPSLIHDKSK